MLLRIIECLKWVNTVVCSHQLRRFFVLEPRYCFKKLLEWPKWAQYSEGESYKGLIVAKSCTKYTTAGVGWYSENQ